MDIRQASDLSKIALGLAAAGFLVTIETMNRTVENGVVTHCDFVDYGALMAGGLATMLGLVAATGGLARRSSGSIALSVAAIALGAWHLAAGTGTIGSPCG